MEIEYLREFVELSQTLNFTKAASRLGVSRTALSKHISALEREFGVMLFDRGGLHTELTSGGKLLLQNAQLCLQSWDAMCDQMALYRKSHPLTLKIGLFKGHKPTDDLVEMTVHSLHQKGVVVDVKPIDITEPCFSALRDGKYDVMWPIHGSDADLTGLSEKPFIREPLVAVVPISHPFAAQDAINPQDLTGNVVMLACGGGIAHYSEYIKFLLAEKGVKPLYTNTPYNNWASFMNSIAFSEGGIYLVHASNVRYAMPIASSSFRAVPFSDETMTVPIYTVWRSNETNPSIGLFVDEFSALASKTDFSVYWR